MSEKQDKNIFIDGLGGRIRRSLAIDFPLSQFILKHKKSSVLFGRDGQTEIFFTSDSKLYLTPAELKMASRKERIVRIIRRLDSLNARSFEKTKIYSTTAEDLFSLKLQRQYSAFRERALELVENSRQKITVVRMWNLSIVGAVIFGMFTMSMIYKYLGQSVSAKIQENKNVQQQTEDTQENILEEYANVDSQYFTQLLSEEDLPQAVLEKKMREMVAGHPIEKMVPLIAEKSPVVAAFMISIAKQESNWGKRVPVYQDEDCWNYWGWRGKNPVGTGGHTCFDSPEDAVNTVAKRLEFLVSNQKLNTPAKMIIWKCGDCSWDNQRDMQRWISTVSTYFQKLDT
ncbi:MAG: hypothetical protein WC608_04225 [Parcubacteria group bacterium]